jgi:UDP-glucose/GDP-mannose dehydrogenase family, UDP binding domain
VRFVRRLRDALWVLKEKRIAVWGLTFKPDTDDVRNSLAVDVINDLIREGDHYPKHLVTGLQIGLFLSTLGSGRNMQPDNCATRSLKGVAEYRFFQTLPSVSSNFLKCYVRIFFF